MKICKRCVMDNSSDDTISFDNNGYCNYCSNALNRYDIKHIDFKLNEKRLVTLFNTIKNNSSNKKYDCIMGLSGGLDSSYLLYLGYKYNLRVLAIHIDDGYDTDICKTNIEKLIKKTNFDFHIIKPDKEQYNNLILSYLKAGVPDICIPQDNILIAFLYNEIKKYKIQYFLSGSNLSTESILQQGNTYTARDVINIKAIFKRFGKGRLDKLKFTTMFDLYLNKYIYKIKTETPLNLINYRVDTAFNELKNFCEYEYYGRKHLENVFTAFAQNYWFPKKFNLDKRKSHLSSMIVSGQISREEAVSELKKPLYNNDAMNHYLNIICDNLGITLDDMNKLICNEKHNHEDYDTYLNHIFYRILKKIKSFV